jgi:hypothetical protein
MLGFMAYAHASSPGHNRLVIRVFEIAKADAGKQLVEAVQRGSGNEQYYRDRLVALDQATGGTTFFNADTSNDVELNWQGNVAHVGYWYAPRAEFNWERPTTMEIFKKIAKLGRAGETEPTSCPPRELVRRMLAAGCKPVKHLDAVHNYVLDAAFDLDIEIPPMVCADCGSAEGANVTYSFDPGDGLVLCRGCVQRRYDAVGAAAQAAEALESAAA